MNRKKFISLFGSSLLGLWSQIFGGISKFNSTVLKSQPMTFGWTSCLTYETGNRRLGFDYFSNLLDEMHSHGMTRLLVMMASHGYFAPQNHGLAWPVQNKKLKYQLDHNAVNAFEESEFFPRVIEKAHKLNIVVMIEIKYLGLIGVEQGYPGIGFKIDRNGKLSSQRIRPEASDYERAAIESLAICCDSPQAHNYMRDKISDVLNRYKNLDGIVLEHPSYSGNTCFCQHSRDRFFLDTGKDMEKAFSEEIVAWKSLRIRDTLIDLKNLVKSINPNFKFGFYSGFSPSDGNIEGFQLNRGHDIRTLRQVGLDFIMPYCEGRHKEREIYEIERVIEYLSPLDCYLHTTIRRDPPHNYKLPPKGPSYIKKMIDWGKRYQKQSDHFKGMTFFNEVKLPPENRKAVYDSI